MGIRRPSYYRYLDKSSKSLNNFHRDDIGIKFRFIKYKGCMSEADYRDEKRKREEYDRMLNAKFLETRETKLYKLCSRIIERAKICKSMYSEAVRLMREKLKEKINERLKWVKSYKYVIKVYRKKRADLIKGIDPYVIPKPKIITYKWSNYNPNEKCDNGVICSLEEDALDCHSKFIDSNEKWVICISNYFDRWGFSNNLEVFKTFAKLSKREGFSFHYREITMSKVKEKYPTDKFDYFYDENNLGFWVREKP